MGLSAAKGAVTPGTDRLQSVRVARIVHPMRYLLFLGALCLLLSACATTPEKRIARNPELFASFPEEVQENVRAGVIQIGYDRDMVRLALGEPDRISTRQREGEELEVWTYMGAYHTSDTYRVRDFGRFSTMEQDIIVDRTRRHTYDRSRVEFRDGEVVAIEQVRR